MRVHESEWKGEEWVESVFCKFKKEKLLCLLVALSEFKYYDTFEKCTLYGL